MATSFPRFAHLRRAGVSCLLSLGEEQPEILWWGTELDGETNYTDLAKAIRPPAISGNLDVAPVIGLVPTEASGWPAEPGLRLRQGHLPISPKLTLVDASSSLPDSPGQPHIFRSVSRDEATGVELKLEIILHPGGTLEVRPSLTNLKDKELEVLSLIPHLPVPADETVILDQSGHHLRERAFQRHDFCLGTYQRQIRGARGHDASSVFGSITPATNWNTGSAHLIHLAWSGNQVLRAVAAPLGIHYLAGGELLESGEGIITKGETFTSAPLLANCGLGLNQVAQRFHTYVRALPNHPHKPRPVTLNAWEAVYFDHSYARIAPLVKAAAEIGIERFVLDDGWFGSRRDDHSGLGDWQVSPEVWPEGLRPLSDLVHENGMEFGLWFEPEMINPDSDLARSHPDWILSSPTHLPLPARFQQVLNLTIPEAQEYIFNAISQVIEEAKVDYIKWDFNRDLLEAMDQRSGKACYRKQTLALYSLLERIRKRFPDLEIESCAGGGGRIDLGIMRYCQRIWGSDCIDPLERQAIESGTKILLPPELIGSHVASDISHTTGRAHTLAFRASTAMFSHMGVEWDLTKTSPEKRQELAKWIAHHKELRDLLHSGKVVQLDPSDPAWHGHGVISTDGNQAIFALTKLASSIYHPGVPIRLAGLDPEAYYQVELDDFTPDSVAGTHFALPWGARNLKLSGNTLMTIGLYPPYLQPESTTLLRLHRLDNIPTGERPDNC